MTLNENAPGSLSTDISNSKYGKVEIYGMKSSSYILKFSFVKVFKIRRSYQVSRSFEYANIKAPVPFASK